MAWNLNIDEAPKGTMTIETFTKKDGKTTDRITRREDWLWLVTEDGEVVKGHWSDKREHWAGVATDQNVIAWQHFVKPEWP